MSTAVASSEVKTARPGQEWLPSYPEDWHLERMKAVFREIAVKGEPNLPLLAATQRMGVVRKETYGQRTVVAQHGLENLKVVEVDDFVISLRSFEGGIEVAHDRGIISPAYTVLRVQDKAYHGYFRHLLKSRYFLDAIRLSVTGIREGQSINYAKLGCTFLPLPPRGDAALIVRYLDHAELRIARAIAGKQELVALMVERQRQIAQEIVLRGTDGQPTTSSNELWLGEVPSNWDLRRMKNWFTEMSTKGRPELPLLAATQTQGVVTKEQYGQRTVVAQQGLENLKVVEEGDFVISLRSFEGGIELSHATGIISPAYTVLRPVDPTTTAYFAGLFKTPAFVDAIRMSVTGIREGQNVNYQRLSRMLVPMPPVEDRARMESELKVALGDGNRAIRVLQEEIALLKEYRTRLISDVVTGKIDVREEAAKLPDIDPAELAAVLAGGTAGADEEEVADGDD